MGKLYFLAGLLLPLFLFSQQQRKNVSYGSERIGFYQHLPSIYNSNTQTKFPLLIFLHGIGERGNGTTELWKVARIAVPKYIADGNPMKFYVNGKWQYFIVLSPQCPLKYSMWPTLYVDAMINYAERNLRVDKNRIYLAGLSMGGGGTWKYASASPANAAKLAAIATSSAPPTMTNGCTIAKAKLPLYAFHAKDDRVVNVSSIYNTINAILSCKPSIKPIEKVWPTGGHNIYDRAFDVSHKYQTPNVYEWMLGYTRNGAGAQSAPPPVTKPTANKPPVAHAGADQVIQHFWNYSPLLNATTSKDPDGWIASVKWTKVNGPAAGTIVNANKLQARAQNLAPGKYTFRVTVTDDKGATAYDDLTIMVNTPPVITILGPQSVTLPVTWAFLQASHSTDPGPNGYIVRFHWSQISGPPCKIVNPNRSDCGFHDLRQGTYVFRIMIWDAYGGISKKDITFKVYPAPKKYSASATLAIDSASNKNQPAGPSGSMGIYPNPAASVINVVLNSAKTGRSSLSVYDVSGALLQTVMLEKNLPVQTESADISALRSGTYVIVARVGTEIISTEQFIKQ